MDVAKLVGLRKALEIAMLSGMYDAGEALRVRRSRGARISRGGLKHARVH